jgi:cysteine synthase
VATGRPSRIEGIGRPRVEPSFVPTIVDRMIRVPDAASIAAMRHLERVTGRRAGGSTGTNLVGAFRLVAEMLAAGRSGSVVTLLCDGGERYARTYYSDAWLTAQGLDVAPHARTIETFAATGRWPAGA